MEEIIEAVNKEKESRRWFGHSRENADEDAAQEVVERVKLKANSPGNPLVSEPIKAHIDLHWAAKQYFRILLTDLRSDLGRIRDHESCCGKSGEGLPSA
jgi:hypothetical protein